MAEEHPRSAAEDPTVVSPSRPHHSISMRIIFFVFLSTFLTAVVVSWISIDAIHRHLGGQVELRFPALLERRVAWLDRYLTTARAELAADLARQTPVSWRTDDDASASRDWNARLSAHPAFSGFAVVGSDGSALGWTDGLTREQATSLAVAVAGRGDASDHVAFSIDGPSPGLVTEIGPISGADRVVALYDPRPIQKLLALGHDEGPGRIVLTDREGLGFLWTDVPSQPSMSPFVPLQRLRSFDEGAVAEYTGAGGRHLLGSARPLGSIDGFMVVEATFDHVYAPLLSVIKRVFLSDLAVILLFSLIAYRITAAIMQPIEALSEGAARISRGDVRHEIPTPKARDEIGLLTRTFNEMMHKLRRSQEEIEQDKLRLTEQNEELQRANEVLAQLSITDGLTKLHNHRFFQDHLTREIKRVSRTGEPLSMLLMDLDDFKRLNDRHGHAAGDEVLMNIAGQMNANVRETDLLARYGGEEFVILTPNTDLHGAVALAEKIRMSVETTSQIIDESMRPIRVTISCGVAQYDGDRKRFFQAADRALYRAKAEGKNCVIAADEDV